MMSIHGTIAKSVPMGDLAGQRLLMLEDGIAYVIKLFRFCFKQAKEDTHFRATSLETLRNMVAAEVVLHFYLI